MNIITVVASVITAILVMGCAIQQWRLRRVLEAQWRADNLAREQLQRRLDVHSEWMAAIDGRIDRFMWGDVDRPGRTWPWFQSLKVPR